MSFLGNWEIDDLLTFPAITHRFDTGALTDADAVPAYRVYEDETGTAILTGTMAKLDDANTTGFYSEQITLSAANGLEVGKCYTIYITAAVNSVTGGSFHTFKVEAAPALASALATAQTSIDDLPTNAELATALGTADDAVLAAIATVQVDTDNIQTRIPAALVSGRMDVSVGAMAANVLTATAINADAITAAKLAADVTTEIQTGLSTSAAVAALQTSVDDVPTNAELTTALGLADDAVLAAIAVVQSDTDNIQTRIPAALVGGRMDSSVGAMAANVMTAAAAAADLTTELQTGLATSASITTLQTSVDDLPTNAELATSQAAADDATLAAIAALNNLSAAQVNAEIVDALATDTYAEPPQGAPPATASLSAKLNYLYKAWRNKKTQTSTAFSLFADDTITVDQKATVSDDGTTFTHTEIAGGP